jgi:hypothetical protein
VVGAVDPNTHNSVSLYRILAEILSLISRYFTPDNSLLCCCFVQVDAISRDPFNFAERRRCSVQPSASYLETSRALQNRHALKSQVGYSQKSFPKLSVLMFFPQSLLKVCSRAVSVNRTEVRPQFGRIRFDVGNLTPPDTGIFRRKQTSRPRIRRPRSRTNTGG